MLEVLKIHENQSSIIWEIKLFSSIIIFILTIGRFVITDLFIQEILMSIIHYYSFIIKE